jgi:hypothetical protein
MIDLEHLARRARVASEWGRARMAARIAVPVAPLVMFPAVLGHGSTRFAALACVLLVIVMFLRWRHRVGVETVRAGLVIGTTLAAAMVVIHYVGFAIRGADAIVPVTIASALAGALLGLGAAWWMARVPRRRARNRAWGLTLFVATLAAGVGAFGLGASCLIAAIVSMAMCSTLAWTPNSPFVL